MRHFSAKDQMFNSRNKDYACKCVQRKMAFHQYSPKQQTWTSEQDGVVNKWTRHNYWTIGTNWCLCVCLYRVFTFFYYPWWYVLIASKTFVQNKDLTSLELGNVCKHLNITFCHFFYLWNSHSPLCRHLRELTFSH